MSGIGRPAPRSVGRMLDAELVIMSLRDRVVIGREEGSSPVVIGVLVMFVSTLREFDLSP